MLRVFKTRLRKHVQTPISVLFHLLANGPRSIRGDVPFACQRSLGVRKDFYPCRHQEAEELHGVLDPVHVSDDGDPPPALLRTRLVPAQAADDGGDERNQDSRQHGVDRIARGT
jgi:hypothetical protein